MSDLVLKYDGYDADSHSLDLRLLGKSLVGFERIATSGLILLEHGRWIRKKEQLTFSLKAQQPVQGSFELPILLGHLAGVLPLIHQALAERVDEVIKDWLSWIMFSLSGREREADSHFESVMAFMREMQDRHENSERENREFLLQTLDRSLGFAKDFVAPIGTSCSSLEIASQKFSGVHVDAEMAETIRKRKDTKLGDLKEYRLRIDGLIIHNRKLQVELVNEPDRYILADVRDPIYDSIPNPYMMAIQSQDVVTVMAKAELKLGEISKLYIMEYKE